MCISSTTPLRTTSNSAIPTPLTSRWWRRPGAPNATTSSWRCPTAIIRWWERAAPPSPAARSSGLLARAILKDAPIVILDEATSSVDPENEHLLLAAIRELTAGKNAHFHRPPALHRPGRGSDRGGGPGTDRSAGDSRCADGSGRPLPPVCSGPGAGRGLAAGITGFLGVVLEGCRKARGRRHDAGGLWPLTTCQVCCLDILTISHSGGTQPIIHQNKLYLIFRLFSSLYHPE